MHYGIVIRTTMRLICLILEATRVINRFYILHENEHMPLIFEKTYKHKKITTIKKKKNGLQRPTL